MKLKRPKIRKTAKKWYSAQFYIRKYSENAHLHGNGFKSMFLPIKILEPRFFWSLRHDRIQVKYSFVYIHSNESSNEYIIELFTFTIHFFARGTLGFSNELMSHVATMYLVIPKPQTCFIAFLSIPFMSSRESWWKSLSLHLNILLTIRILYFWASAALSLMIIGSLRLLSLVCPTINPKKVTSLDNHERIIARK